MLTNVKLLDTMSALASYSAQRHAVIADNIANADTPNFVAKDMQPFAEIFETSMKDGQNVKNLQAKTITMPMGDVASPNGNTVSLEQQMMLSAENKGQHDMALAVYRKSLDMFKMAIGKNL